MSDCLAWIVAFIFGALLGTIFFGGLWWTIHKGMASENPALWFLSSFLARTSISLLGFYFIADGRFEGLISSLLGFLGARLVITQLKKGAEDSALLESEGSHAP